MAKKETTWWRRRENSKTTFLLREKKVKKGVYINSNWISFDYRARIEKWSHTHTKWNFNDKPHTYIDMHKLNFLGMENSTRAKFFFFFFRSFLFSFLHDFGVYYDWAAKKTIWMHTNEWNTNWRQWTFRISGTKFDFNLKLQNIVNVFNVLKN